MIFAIFFNLRAFFCSVDGFIFKTILNTVLKFYFKVNLKTKQTDIDLVDLLIFQLVERTFVRLYRGTFFYYVTQKLAFLIPPPTLS